MRHLANAQYWDRPAGGNTGRLFLAFGGPVCADRFGNCPLDRVLTYKNLIYLLNLQFRKCSDVVRFDFGCLLQGQTRTVTAQLKSAYNSLVVDPRCLQGETNL